MTIARLYKMDATPDPLFREAWIVTEAEAAVLESDDDDAALQNQPGQGMAAAAQDIDAANEQEIDPGTPAQFVVNRGSVGHESTTDAVKDVTYDKAVVLLEAFLEQCAEDGFRDIPFEEQDTLLVQYALKTREGTARDEYFEAKTRQVLTQHFAWRGLGVVVDSERGEFRLNHLVKVPDAKRAIKAALVALRPYDPTKLTLAVAKAGTEDFVLKHPVKGTFSRFGK